MRMRELEERSGVGRETIRYYIREGLLPEPARAARNSALYADAHLVRLRAIRRLQEERFLPLAVIRAMLDAADGERWLAPDAFPQLDHMLRAAVDADARRWTRDALMADTGVTPAGLAEAEGSGVLRAGGDGRFGARDLAIVRILVELTTLGLDDGPEHAGEALKVYAEAVDWLVGQDMKLFFDRTAGRVDDREAARIAERGLALSNELLTHLRTAEILRRLEARRRIANDR